MKNCIKELRRARGLRQEDLAGLLGVSRQTIVVMENNKYGAARKREVCLCLIYQKNV
ncbi:helix-turn-helix transcriptional regulator [Agathobaculum desmolans]|uniref:helix-turn-helix transcriptional regulator n=1 Tax=Agathobaculum desmolans TaxID=39484 RepID=UPI002ED4042A